MRDGFLAGAAPCGPKVEENDFSFELRKGDFLPVKGLEGEIRRWANGELRLLPRTMGKKKDRYGAKTENENFHTEG